METPILAVYYGMSAYRSLKLLDYLIHLYSAQRKWRNGENNRLGLGLG